MSTQNKPTALSAGLIAVKGQAVSAVQSEPPPVARLPSLPAPALGYLKAMTLKLDGERYRQLKQLGLDRGKTSQELLVEAVDMLLAKGM